MQTENFLKITFSDPNCRVSVLWVNLIDKVELRHMCKSVLLCKFINHLDNHAQEVPSQSIAFAYVGVTEFCLPLLWDIFKYFELSPW